MAECWCGGSPWRHQWRNKSKGVKEPLCDEARKNLREYYNGWVNRPGNREKVNAQKRARRGGVDLLETEEL